MITTATAAPIMRSAWRRVLGRDASETELHGILAIARLETGYGTGWPTPEGRAAHNWGAIQTSPNDPQSFAATDTHPTSSGGATPYVAQFKKYATDEDGAGALVNWFRSHAASLAALSSGVSLELSAAMHAAGYYEGRGATVAERVRNHAQAVQRNAEAIAARLHSRVLWRLERAPAPPSPPPAPPAPPPASSSGGGARFVPWFIVSALLGALVAQLRGR